MIIHCKLHSFFIGVHLSCGRSGLHVVRKSSWKNRGVGKSEMKLERMKFERSSRSWKRHPKLENDHWSWKILIDFKISNFTKTFQLLSLLCKLNGNFSFFQPSFPTTCKPNPIHYWKCKKSADCHHWWISKELITCMFY